ncbi:hypothetical protein NIES1031_07200 [Chroogloeocystis siderophila 5.2 s.c.1]|uniref:Lipoprotein n=1 Tax=Chroogloeocystis siderophila 5.2 s.c.1 TaxID=247279 RepID=A0A1U7HVU3_9CHRO|nr:hypothetical protein NIES1031_07200 [Chroogloeocystis siderophila 5.2 s.c.1]
MKNILRVVVGMMSAIALTSCSTMTIDQYEATAQTTYTWQVRYSTSPSDKLPRFETFATTSLLNRNGQQPAAAVTGPDDQGLWWPALPPRPTVDQIEQRQRPQEKPSTPELLKSVNYQITYIEGSKQRTLPTNSQVYRQVVKAYQSQRPLRLTLGVNNASVEKAEPL